MDLQRKAIAEVLGTLWPVLGGCGSAVLAGLVHRYVIEERPQTRTGHG